MIKSQPGSDSDSCSSSDRKKKQEKRSKSTQKTYQDLIVKFVGFSLIPLLLLLIARKSGWFHSGSEPGESKMKVKTTEIQAASAKTSKSMDSDTLLHLSKSNMQGINRNVSTIPLRIQIASDFHIEFYDEKENLDFLIEPKAPILALLGDVGYACTNQLRNFLLSQSDRFEQVWFLAGNHEYYNHGTKYSVTEQHDWLQKVASERPNLQFLEKTAIPMLDGSVMVLATTLWSDIPDNYLDEAEHFLNDYHLSYNHAPTDTSPRLLRATETREWYRQNLNWLQTWLKAIYEQNKLRAQRDAKAPQTKVVVLTHHTPLMIGTSAPQFEGTDSTHCFSSDLEDLLSQAYSPIEVWACGHTHYNFDLAIPQSDRSDEGKLVRVVSNQRGYKNRPKADYRADGVVLEIHPSDL